MDQLEKNKIIKMLVVLAAIVVIAGSLTKLANGDSMSLTDYVAQNASPQPQTASPAADDTASPSPTAAVTSPSAPSAEVSPAPAVLSTLTGAALNGGSQLTQRSTYTDGFYFEPVSDSLRRYMTGVSYPSDSFLSGDAGNDGAQSDAAQAEISFEELRYVHIWHYDFTGKPAEGELVCNEYIAQDILEIFYELYRNEYRLEKVLLIDEYDGNAVAAMEDNNSFCFYYDAQGSDNELSRHALGLALDINPCYNPRVTYEKDGSETIIPASAADYANRSSGFPYKIDENDLCFRLFAQHGFTWGGNRNDGKDYMHFQKSKP